MKRNIKKVIVSITMCICILLTSVLYASAESITISENSDLYGRGYSWHYEYTRLYNASGYSEANCLHKDTEDVMIYAYLRTYAYDGNTYTKALCVSTKRSGETTRTKHVDTTSLESIEWNEALDFLRGYSTQIIIEESATHASDGWAAVYTYYWGYKPAIDGNTIISGEYTTE